MQVDLECLEAAGVQCCVKLPRKASGPGTPRLPGPSRCIAFGAALGAEEAAGAVGLQAVRGIQILLW